MSARPRGSAALLRSRPPGSTERIPLLPAGGEGRRVGAMSLFNLDRFRYEKRRTSAEQDGRPAAAAQEEGSPAAAAQAQEEGSPAAGARAQEEGSSAADGGGNNTAGSSRPGSPASVAAGESGVVCSAQCECCIVRSKALCPSCAAFFFCCCCWLLYKGASLYTRFTAVSTKASVWCVLCLNLCIHGHLITRDEMISMQAAFKIHKVFLFIDAHLKLM